MASIRLRHRRNKISSAHLSIIQPRYSRCSVPSCHIRRIRQYARLLQPYVGDNSRSKGIILIEGPQFCKELARLKEKFLVACFPDITKLSPRRAVSVILHDTPSHSNPKCAQLRCNNCKSCRCCCGQGRRRL